MKPLRYLSSIDGQAKIKLRKSELTWDHVRKWDESIQPIINRFYVKANDPKILSDKSAKIRADVKWSWRVNYALSKLSSLVDALNEIPSKREAFLARGMLLEIEDDVGEYLPFAPIIFAPRFRCFLDQCIDGQDLGVRGFIWYLTKAPDEYLKVKQVKNKPTDVVKGLIYAACEAIYTFDSLGLDDDLPYKQSIVLHADVDGGGRLRDSYLKLGLVACKQQSVKISTFRSGNDAEEYFVLSKEKADNLTNEVNAKELVDS